MMDFTEEQKAAIRAVINAEVDRRLAELEAANRRPSLLEWLQGGVRSWTVWSGTLVIIAPELLDALAPLVTEQWGADVWKRVVQLVGVLMIVLRARTTTSLPQRAATGGTGS